ncbi:MAG: SBBP repeat-containing protein, partial [Bacteroidota bacterium]
MKLKFILITLFALCNTKYYTQVFDWGKIEGLWAYDYGYGTTVDNNGNIYVTGKYEQQANFSGTIINNRGNHDVFLSKYDPNGNLIWIKTAGGALGDYGTSLSCDGNSYVYLAGEMEGYGIPISFDNSNITFNTVGDNDMFFAKYDLSGNLIWAKHAGAYKNDKALGITYDKLGNVIICGLFVDTTIFEGNNYLFGKGDKDIFIAKFDSSGNYLWGKSAGSPHRDEAKSVICDTAGNIYVTGMFSDTVDFGGINLISANGYFDMFIAKYDPSGNLIWVKQGSSDYDEVGWGITITNDEKIVVTGEFNAYALFENQALTTTGMSDVFIAAYNNNGTLAWLNSAGGPLIERARAIGTDGNHIYITGQFGGTCNFGNNQLIASDSSDVFITALDNNGNFIWSTRISGIQDSTENLGYESGNSICAFAGDGSVYATGAVLDGGTFDQSNINGYKRTDIFICKIHTEIPNSTIESNPTKFLKINNPCYN